MYLFFKFMIKIKVYNYLLSDKERILVQYLCNVWRNYDHYINEFEYLIVYHLNISWQYQKFIKRKILHPKIYMGSKTVHI